MLRPRKYWKPSATKDWAWKPEDPGMREPVTAKISAPGSGSLKKKRRGASAKIACRTCGEPTPLRPPFCRECRKVYGQRKHDEAYTQTQMQRAMARDKEP